MATDGRGPLAAGAIAMLVAVAAGAFGAHALESTLGAARMGAWQTAVRYEAWHGLAARRLDRWPGSLLATATHDTKRGEDARARLAALSEIPEAWAETVRYWRALNAPHRMGEPAIHPKDEYTLYQTLVGVWPPGLDADAAEELTTLRGRLLGWQMKALREGKERSDWNAPDEAYERAAAGFLESLLDAQRSRAFLEGLAAFVARLAPIGAANSLAQLLLKLTSPGVPDLYQGDELECLSLVDPDNRRPVDFGLRQRLLVGERPAKLDLVQRALALRERRGLGRYEPLDAGPEGIAFRRGEDVVVGVGLRGPARISLPPGRWRDVLADREIGDEIVLDHGLLERL